MLCLSEDEKFSIFRYRLLLRVAEIGTIFDDGSRALRVGAIEAFCNAASPRTKNFQFSATGGFPA